MTGPFALTSSRSLSPPASKANVARSSVIALLPVTCNLASRQCLLL
jgi:hypothetical protein